MLKASPVLPDLIDDDLREWAQELMDVLRKMSFDGVGISRETYGAKETEGL